MPIISVQRKDIRIYPAAQLPPAQHLTSLHTLLVGYCIQLIGVRIMMQLPPRMILAVSICASCFLRCKTAAFSYHPLYNQRSKCNLHLANKNWDVGDDWSKLSDETDNVLFEPSSTDEMINPAAVDRFLDDVIDSMHIDINTGGVGLYDYKLIDEDFETYVESEHFFDEAAKEIGMLVRCNEEPAKLLVETGKALEPLADEERYDNSALIDTGTNTPSQFFNDSIAVIFQEHATRDGCLDDVGVAGWMTKCLNDKHTKFDKQG